MKRASDFVVSLLLILIALPLWAIVAIAIKLDSPGPVFYHALRIGKDGKPFYLYKFRSMVTNADKTGPGITTDGDNRITSIGRFLRRTKIDELPQLINVLKGEMSLVGPRPEDACYVALYAPKQKEILKFRPGITSAASLAYRHEEQILRGSNWETVYCSEILPAKIELDLAYLSKRTLFSDLLLIGRTILSIFR